MSQAVLFLLDVLFDLLSALFALRFLLQLLQADYHNPVSQALVRLSDPPLRPLRKFLPRHRRMDSASLLAICLVQGVRLCVFALLLYGSLPSASGLVMLTVAHVVQFNVRLFMLLIFVVVVLSWVNPGSSSPVANILHQLCEPLLRALRGRLPPLGGLDMSPLVALVLLQLVSLLFVAPLLELGNQLSDWPAPARLS